MRFTRDSDGCGYSATVRASFGLVHLHYSRNEYSTGGHDMWCLFFSSGNDRTKTDCGSRFDCEQTAERLAAILERSDSFEAFKTEARERQFTN